MFNVQKNNMIIASSECESVKKLVFMSKYWTL